MEKNKKFVKRAFSVMLVFVMIINCLSVCDCAQASMFSSGKSKVAEFFLKEQEPIKRKVDKIASKVYEIRNNAKSYIVTSKKHQTQSKIEKKFEKYIINDYKSFDVCKKCINISLTNAEKEDIESTYNDVIIEEDVTVSACGFECSFVDENAGNNEVSWNQEIINVDSNDININQDSEKKVKVAIIDSGVDGLSDIDVAESINFVPGEEDLFTYFEDQTGHGTSIAGIIAAANDEVGITGINPNVEIYSAKVFNGTNSAPLSRILNGIYWAIEKNVDIINMSFGVPNDSPALKKAIDSACEKGILVVAAVGNNGNDSEVLYPAEYDNVLGVGSIDSMGKISDFSSVGHGVDVVAPGENIISTSILNGVVGTEGTSMSVPHVVGVASLLMEKDLSRDGKFISGLLKSSARDLGDESKYGKGLIDYEFACDIYDEYVQEYDQIEKKEELQSQDKIKNNDVILEDVININELNVSQQEECVVGQWSSSDENGHKGIATEATDSRGVSLTSNQLKMLRIGATFNDYQKDKNYPSLRGLNDQTYGDNGDWHGKGGNDYDYIAAYFYVACLANRGISNYSEGKGEVLGVLDNYMTAQQYKRMKKQFSKVYAKDDPKCFLRQYITDNGGDYSERRYFLIGMALHIIADVYAHSTYCYNKNTGKWEHITHENNNADNINYPKDSEQGRRKAAVAVCTAAFYVAYKKNKPNAIVFSQGRDIYNPDKYKFKVAHLYDRIMSKITEIKKYEYDAVKAVTYGSTNKVYSNVWIK